MAEAASAQQAATATAEDTSQQRAGRRRRTSAELRRAQQGASAATTSAPAALDSLSRLQQLADASPQVAQLRRMQALANARFAPVAQLAGGPEEEVLVQGKFATVELQPQLQQAPRANNTGLPDQLKSGIESLSGLSLDDVRVYNNSAQPAQLNALAYAQGSDIHLAPDQEQHLPHEAWHVVQQAQGRVRPTLQLKDGVPVNDDNGLEGEAAEMGERAVQLKGDIRDSRRDTTHAIQLLEIQAETGGLGNGIRAHRENATLNSLSAAESSVQRAIDTNKLNVVGEDHRLYNPETRAAEGRKVTTIFGEDTYHTEDTFSAMPDIAQEGGDLEERDNLQSFASKADPPYYAITQGLTFISNWCSEFRNYSLDKQMVTWINGAMDRIEKETNSSPLAKLEGSTEEREFVNAHDKLLVRQEIIDDPNYPDNGRKVRVVNHELKEAVDGLKLAADAYLLKIETQYAKAKKEFEGYMGINPEDNLIKKRSVTMGFHAMVHAIGGNKGVLKVGELHLDDFAGKDLGGATLSNNDEFQRFLQQREARVPVMLMSMDETDASPPQALQLAASVGGSLKSAAALAQVVQRVSTPTRKPVQLLSEFDPYEWKSQLMKREDLRDFHRFKEIAAAASNWDGVSEDDTSLGDLKQKIKNLGEEMLSNDDDVAHVYRAIQKYFPEDYLTSDDVSLVKKYNFDGPVAFTGENLMAWLRLAAGDGTVDDLRYIHHEIYEIKQIQRTNFKADLQKTEPSEDFWDNAYSPAHSEALMVEIRFLMHAVNLIYKKDYNWKQVAASDRERREDFLGTLYSEGEVPVDENDLPDLDKMLNDHVDKIDDDLSELLSSLKKKRLGKPG
jgi:hypothetical protein